MTSYTIKEQAGIHGALEWLFNNASKGLQGGPVVVTIGREIRTPDQNSKIWPMLSDVAGQVVWHGGKLEKEDWKDVFTAAWSKQRIVPGIDSGFVAIGQRTSKMDKVQFSDLIEIIYAFGATQCVKWSEPALNAYEQYRFKPDN